jgi:hypothetical protein
MPQLNSGNFDRKPQGNACTKKRFPKNNSGLKFNLFLSLARVRERRRAHSPTHARVSNVCLSVCLCLSTTRKKQKQTMLTFAFLEVNQNPHTDDGKRDDEKRCGKFRNDI